MHRRLEVLDVTVINYSEFSPLAQCERKWAYAFVLGGIEPGPKPGLHLGTLCHLWHGRWLTGEGATLPSEWSDDINTEGKPGEVRTLALADFDPELVERALWLAGRFVKHYGSQPPSSWNVISAEQWIAREFSWGTLVGRTDGFVEIDGELWLIEVKSYKQKPGPLAYAAVSPQLGCYSLLAEEAFGTRPRGILYQGICTHQWVKEREPEESFQQIVLTMNEKHLAATEKYLAAATWRRHTLQWGPDNRRHYEPQETLYLAIPNVGRDCSWCGFKPQCWNDLGGVDPFEIEAVDEDDE